jgi:hypothetical protein
LKSGRRPAPQDAGAGPNDPPVLLRDSDQPFVYDIRFSKKKFTLELYDTSSPNQHWTSLKPDVVVLAFDISNRDTLAGLQGVCAPAALLFYALHMLTMTGQWRNDIIRYFQHGTGERIPVMMLGLKRDLRKEDESIIYPQEVCDSVTGCEPGSQLTIASRPTESRKSFVVIGMPSVRL